MTETLLDMSASNTEDLVQEPSRPGTQRVPDAAHVVDEPGHRQPRGVETGRTGTGDPQVAGEVAAEDGAPGRHLPTARPKRAATS